METKDLVKIITTHKDQYTPDAIRAANDELRSRGETSETMVPIVKEAKAELLRQDRDRERKSSSSANLANLCGAASHWIMSAFIIGFLFFLVRGCQ
jgi:hypothetical protein